MKQINFTPLSECEQLSLKAAIYDNAYNNSTILMDPEDTSFIGSTTIVPDDEVISAIKSVPCHY